MDSGVPKLLRNPLIVLGGNGLPVGRGLGLEPLEIVDLVPLVAGGVLTFCQLDRDMSVKFDSLLQSLRTNGITSGGELT